VESSESFAQSKAGVAIIYSNKYARLGGSRFLAPDKKSLRLSTKRLDNESAVILGRFPDIELPLF